MGFLNKLKGVFFEVEEEEVEEEEKDREPKEKVAVAKKIETPEVRRREESVVPKEEKMEFESNTLEEFKKEKEVFPSFDDKDFEVEKTIELDEPIREITEEEPKIERPVVEEYHYEEVRYEEPAPKVEEPAPYHGLYEGSKEREVKPSFTPSPIISPIYGILNKNYKKEEIVTKKEVRLSQTSTKKADLDVVREKAYGDLAGDISLSIEEGNDGVDREIDTKEDLLYDLSEESPKVKAVTVGDAEEYYNDLGLEYNVDYKVEEDKPKKVDDEIVDIKEDKKEDNKIELDESNDDRNIFDLIDSMYEDKE